MNREIKPVHVYCLTGHARTGGRHTTVRSNRGNRIMAAHLASSQHKPPAINTTSVANTVDLLILCLLRDNSEFSSKETNSYCGLDWEFLFFGFFKKKTFFDHSFFLKGNAILLFYFWSLYIIHDTLVKLQRALPSLEFAFWWFTSFTSRFRSWEIWRHYPVSNQMCDSILASSSQTMRITNYTNSTTNMMQHVTRHHSGKFWSLPPERKKIIWPIHAAKQICSSTCSNKCKSHRNYEGHHCKRYETIFCCWKWRISAIDQHIGAQVLHPIIPTL